MAKTYTVDLPITQTRELRYTRQERLDFEKRFRDRGKPGMKELLHAFVLPSVETAPGKAEATAGGDLEMQEYLLFLGLRHLGNVVTEKRVTEWLGLASEEGRPLIGFIGPAVCAVYASGVLGFVYEPKEPVPEAVEADPKAEATA